MSAVFQVGAQGRHLIHEAARRCNVLLRVIDDEQVAVVRDGVRQQVEGADGEVLPSSASVRVSVRRCSPWFVV